MFTSKFKAIAAVIAAGCALLIGAGVAGRAYADNPAEKPVTSVIVTGIDCPSEDSCTVDYQGGTWTVRLVTP